VWVALFTSRARPLIAGSAKNALSEKFWQIAAAGVPFLVAQFIGIFSRPWISSCWVSSTMKKWLGDYSAALKILGISLGVINALVAAVQPRLARGSQDLRSPKMKNLMVNTTQMIVVFPLSTLVGCWFFGNELVYWIFGPSL